MTPWTAARARLSCISLSPRVCSNSCPLSRWCHPTISSSATPSSFCLQSFPASGSFPTSLFFTIRWPKYWSFNFSICSSSEYSALLDSLVWSLCTLKSLLQHRNLCYWVGKKFVWVFPLDITEKPEQNFGQFNICVPWITHLSLTYPSKEECTCIPTFQMRNLRLKEYI